MHSYHTTNFQDQLENNFTYQNKKNRGPQALPQKESLKPSDMEALPHDKKYIAPRREKPQWEKASPHQMLPKRSGGPDFGGFGSPNLGFPESPPDAAQKVFYFTTALTKMTIFLLHVSLQPTRFMSRRPPHGVLRKSELLGPKTSKFRSRAPSGHHLVGTPEISGLGTQNLQIPECRIFWAAIGGDSGNQSFWGPKPPNSRAPYLVGQRQFWVVYV